MKRFYLISLLCIILVALSGAFGAQATPDLNQQDNPKRTPENEPKLIQLRRDFKNSFPIPAGEKLEYEVKFSRFPIYATVGIVTFDFLGAPDPLPEEVKHSGTENAESDAGTDKPVKPLLEGLNIDFRPSPKDRLFQLRATAVSKGILIAILGINVKDRFETIVDAYDFSARLSLTEIKEGKKHTIQSVLYDKSDQTVKYQTNDLANPQNQPRVKQLAHQDGMMSLLSAFYFVRFQRYKEGHIIRFPVSSDEENYVFDIVVGKKEQLKTDCGKVRTVKLEPKLFGPGQFFNRKGEMTMWVTDDKRHIPLRLVAKTSSGTITAKLLNFKKDCRIEDPQPDEPLKTDPGTDNH